MEYIKKINIHPYTANVWFTNSRRLHLNKCRAAIGPREEPADAHCSGCCSYDAECMNIVIGLFSDNPYTLVHEVGHAVINIFEGVGMPINGDTSEAFCYLLDSMYKQCYQIHDKLRDTDNDEQETTQTQEQATIADIARGTSIRTAGDEKPPAPPAPGA